MAKNEPFSERVKRLREERGWSQTELAEKARLAPAALSRILSGGRDLRMEHLVELAAALELSLTELVAGTTAANVVQDWIPRSRLEESERARVEVIRALDLAKSEVAARTAEFAAVRKVLEDANSRVEQLELEREKARAEVQAARERRSELLLLRKRVVESEGQLERFEAEVNTLRATLGACREESAQHQRFQEETQAQLAQMQGDLAQAKNGQLFAGAVGLFLGNVVLAKNRRRG